ncbi:hypothetical protein, partial [Burkholderia multivorans]
MRLGRIRVKASPISPVRNPRIGHIMMGTAEMPTHVRTKSVRVCGRSVKNLRIALFSDDGTAQPPTFLNLTVVAGGRPFKDRPRDATSAGVALEELVD